MISKLKTGSSFAGALRYDSKKEGAQTLAKNGIFSDSWEDQAREFDAVANSRPDLSKPVWHVSLSAPDGQRYTDGQWRVAADAWLKQMGFDPEKTQYLITRHSDAAHDHIHVIANRVQLDGKVIENWQNFKRSHEATRAAEIAAGVPRFEEHAATMTGKRAGLRTDIQACVNGKPTLAEFKSRLADRGITMIENRQSTGRLSGLSFEHDGRTWKGSEIARDCSLGSLKKQGLQVDAKPIEIQSTPSLKTGLGGVIQSISQQIKKQEKEYSHER